MWLQGIYSPISLEITFSGLGMQAKQQVTLLSWGLFLNPGLQLSLYTECGVWRKSDNTW